MRFEVEELEAVQLQTQLSHEVYKASAARERHDHWLGPELSAGASTPVRHGYRAR